MKLTLGFSTCPNDTFIFDAMVHQKIDTEGLSFEVLMGDVEELNRGAFEHKIDITKLSYFAYAHIADKYKLLTSGSALGRGNGPLLISKSNVLPSETKGLKVAIPGKNTTANLLFSIFYPEIIEKKEMLFSEIEDAVADGRVDAGLIIHENRFTYQSKGLKKIADLGAYWEEKTGSPIPLGAIVVNRKLDAEIQKKVNRVLKRSIQFAFANPTSSHDFVKKYAQEMSDEVIQKHIGLYVNSFTLELGEEGENAIKSLYDYAMEKQIVVLEHNDIFVRY